MPFRGGPGFGLQYRTKEERSAIAKKSAASRMKNNYEKLMLQKCMKALLEMDVPEKYYEETLKKFGFDHRDYNNKTLLMVALFKKGLTGDVPAIREIIDMMEKLDLYRETKRVQEQVNVYIVPTGTEYQPSEEEEKEIQKIENPVHTEQDRIDKEWGIEGEEQEEYETESKNCWDVPTSDDIEEWGNDIYNG